METLKPLKDVVDQDVKTSGKLIFAKSLKLYPEMKPHLPIDYGKQIYLLISTCTLLLSLWSTAMKGPISIAHHFHY